MRMPFGKHRGKELRDIPDDYLLWVLGNIEYLNPVLRREIERRLGILEDRPAGHHPGHLDPIRARVNDAVNRCRRRLAAGLHPDRGGDTRLMQLANEAIDELAAAVTAAFTD